MLTDTHRTLFCDADWHTSHSDTHRTLFCDADWHTPPTKEEVYVFARVHLSVCLWARLLKNAYKDLDQMLRVDRCRDMDELINFWAQSGL